MTENHLTTIDTTGALVPRPQAEFTRSAILEELFSSHSTTLYRIALQKLGNPADAEDALQDALLSAFKHFSQFKGNAKVSTWLTTIVLNAARMELRRRSNRRIVALDSYADETHLSKPEVLADAAPNPEETLRSTQVREILERLMGKLSPKIRPAFRLRVLEGLSTKEAAKRLGVSEGTLKAQYFRARRQMTPLIRRAFVSPADRRNRLSAARVRAFLWQGAGISREPAAERRVA